MGEAKADLGYDMRLRVRGKALQQRDGNNSGRNDDNGCNLSMRDQAMHEYTANAVLWLP